MDKTAPIIAFSVVIPARKEAANIGALLDGIAAACDPIGNYEIIVVDDASDDGMATVLAARAAGQSGLRVLHHDRAGEQSAAVHTGVMAAKGPIICTLDGDGQNPPEELARLLAPLLAIPSGSGGPGTLGLVAGQRVGRQDTWSKRIASRFANGLRARILRDGTRDTGRGLKAFRRDGFLTLPYFDHMHRYLPALFARGGWSIAHIDVTHRARGGGKSHYSNLQRGLVGIVDLARVAWLLRRRKKTRATENRG